MKKIVFFSALLFTVVVSINAILLKTSKISWSPDTPISEVLFQLGEPKPKHFLKEPSQDMIDIGFDLVTKGKTKNPPKGEKSAYISKHYVCTSCHNIQREDPDLRKSDPEARLDYVVQHNLPFLQGTTFYGAVNRETWYNDDYVKKYGSLVEPAKNDLQEAIQLCAKECSQGRYLEGWELEAVVSYLWTIQITLGDLGLNEKEIHALALKSENKQAHEQLRSDLKSRYSQKSPATFSDVPSNKGEGYPYQGDAEKGKQLYNQSCLFCHKSRGVSSMAFDNSRATMRAFQKNITKDNSYSLYNIIKHGTYPVPGHKPYMPLYPDQRMSNQQIEDIRAYIESRLE